MRVAIGSDHAGFELKSAVRAFLVDGQHDVVDVGTYDTEPTDYPDYAEAVGSALREARAERGILLCGSGVGAAMAANRIPGIRAGLCHDTYSAHQGVEHDGMNVLVLGGRVIGSELARELVGTFLRARFSADDRHLKRLAKLTALENPLRALQVFGQAVWLDYIRHSLVTSGDLRRLIEHDGLKGVTSNPSIFEKAVTGSSDYRDLLESPDARGVEAKALYERLAVRDVQEAADALRPIYEVTAGRDGYVSLEVSPALAHDTAGTLDEARRLKRAVGRDNLMIKVPATPAGIRALHALVSEGVNVNATLLFAVDAYEQVAEAYVSGLEKLAVSGGDVRRVASVASFFVSRIDTAVDEVIALRQQAGESPRELALLRGLRGRVAIANARLAYQRYLELFSGARWQRLAAAGANTQRLLWASTGTKNPALHDTLYVEELIGPDTVTTLPPATLEAFREHGRPRASLTEDVEAATDTMQLAAAAGISMKQLTDGLLADGVRLFAEAFQHLLEAVDKQRQGTRAERSRRLSYRLPEALAADVETTLGEWRAHGKVRQLWSRDVSLWTGKDEARWLGWLGVTNGQLAHLERLNQVRDAAKASGFTHVLLLGMGGSSLGPELLQRTFGPVEGFPRLHVLDSTDPAQVRRLEFEVELERTLFVVSSKSGSTLEPNVFEQYFFDRVAQRVGPKEAGRRFIAITDPGSKLQHVAEAEGFRRVFFGWPDIGGRYSVLSDFGLVPAALMGVDVPRLLERAEQMVYACMPSVPIEENAGVVPGVILGVSAWFGRDKLTIVCSPGLAALGAWLEQLVAESTGKEGEGILPIAGEVLGRPDAYGNDRLFLYLRLATAPDAAQDEAVDALERAGHAVVRVGVDDVYAVGAELFRWEIATAVAGAILGVHPFDQPDVEASKVLTRKLLGEYEASGSAPQEAPIFRADGISLFADPKNAAVLTTAAAEDSLKGYLTAHLNRLAGGDYFALLAYLDMNEANERTLQAMRHAVRDGRRVATCLQFGPRFLHSTGQFYKGGPNTGVFLQLTCDDAAELPVPGQKYGFSVIKAAQARADLQVLADRERRVMRVHFSSDVAAGLGALQRAIAEASASVVR